MRISILLLFILSSWHCTPKGSIRGQLQLSGSTAEEWKLYLIRPMRLADIASSYTGDIIDSATLEASGKFRFKGLPKSSSAIFYEIVLQKRGERFPNRLTDDDPLLSNYLPILYSEGETILISAEAKAFQATAQMHKPSAANAELLLLRDKRVETFRQYLQSKSADAHDEEKMLEYAQALEAYRNALHTPAESTSRLYVALLALQWAKAGTDYERLAEFVDGLCTKWRTSLPDDPFVKDLCLLSDPSNRPILVGDLVPNEGLPLLSGGTGEIRRLLGPKLTLLDFWASWCAPCRKENRNTLVPLWSEYHERGFQIIGYALESDRKLWEKAIQRDSVHLWPHASHLQGDEAPFLKTLRLTTIPANLLLDAQGKILAKNLHGEELRRFVEAYLK